MSEDTSTIKGGCLCGAVRYEAQGEPMFAGYCCCADCRKASGSGFIPFMGFTAKQVRFTGPTRHSFAKSIRGGDAVRNHCAICGGLVYGGVVGKDEDFTVYAGSLDDPSAFHPTMVIFARDKPDWVTLPPGLKTFDTMPG